ncbi:pyridoxal phosphate-dependent aminotransferase [Metallosphaera tengchongensis]|uniref:Aminotransferase n=1 Tax=Metallosphaera tengchongensis TaxID=1532350 RepID=A0A6N0NRJ7_9CREN|nr:pyridoxal phosphate-dependent aminotransferase [Metallosphaera tengchongensis]QKQ99331.1 pyridoxal phosphate-dependent aminotransferase [Metallosphaera tengchongensis]
MESFASSLSKLTGESTLLYQEIARKVEKTKGIKTINFGIGQPDLPTPQRIRDEAKVALEKGYTAYTPALGLDELRSKIAEFLSQKYGDKIIKDEIAVTPGAKTALFLAFLAYVNPGDEVILFDPSFYSYAEVVKLLGGKPVYVPLHFDQGKGFYYVTDELSSKISPKTKMIVYNNPHNPTGMTFDADLSKTVAEISQERKIVLISDEIYDYFVFDKNFWSVLQTPSWRDNVIYINGFSKTFSMTGWRLGYIVARKEVIGKMGILASNIYTCPTSFAQYGALASFDSFAQVKEMIDLFRRRRDVMYNELSGVKGIKVYKSSGAFYMFPDFSEVLGAGGMDSKSLAVKLIEEAGVVTIPGEVFPERVGKNFLRLSFALGEEKIKEGVSRMKLFVEKVLSS